MPRRLSVASSHATSPCHVASRATSPHTAVDLISMQGKTNFFERRVGEYQKAGVAAAATRAEGDGAAGRRFALDADF